MVTWYELFEKVSDIESNLDVLLASESVMSTWDSNVRKAQVTALVDPIFDFISKYRNDSDDDDED